MTLVKNFSHLHKNISLVILLLSSYIFSVRRNADNTSQCSAIVLLHSTVIKFLSQIAPSLLRPVWIDFRTQMPSKWQQFQDLLKFSYCLSLSATAQFLFMLSSDYLTPLASSLLCYAYSSTFLQFVIKIYPPGLHPYATHPSSKLRKRSSLTCKRPRNVLKTFSSCCKIITLVGGVGV